jgi:hypothetical protein
MPAGPLPAVGIANWSTFGGKVVVGSVDGGAVVGAGDDADDWVAAGLELELQAAATRATRRAATSHGERWRTTRV